MSFVGVRPHFRTRPANHLFVAGRPAVGLLNRLTSRGSITDAVINMDASLTKQKGRRTQWFHVGVECHLIIAVQDKILGHGRAIWHRWSRPTGVPIKTRDRRVTKLRSTLPSRGLEDSFPPRLVVTLGIYHSY